MMIVKTVLQQLQNVAIKSIIQEALFTVDSAKLLFVDSVIILSSSV